LSAKIINSFIISFSVSIIATGFSFMNGYAIGIGRIKNANVYLVIFMLGITLPAVSFVYPHYYMFKAIGLYNTRIPVILIISAMFMAWGTYIFSSVLKTFPRSYIESAKIDGCRNINALMFIVFPLSKPIIAVVFVFFFIWSWNEFFVSLIFLISDKIQTMPLGIVMFQDARSPQITALSAGAFLGIIPCLIFFLLFQKTLIRGITAGGIKG